MKKIIIDKNQNTLCFLKLKPGENTLCNNCPCLNIMDGEIPSCGMGFNCEEFYSETEEKSWHIFSFDCQMIYIRYCNPKNHSEVLKYFPEKVLVEVKGEE